MIRSLQNAVMAGIELIKTFLQQASARGSRSTVLYTLAWGLFLLISAMLVAVFEHAPTWIIVLLATLMTLFGLSYLFAFFFFMIKNPDALRSEQFTLSKMQIERSQIGDTSHGFQEVEPSAGVQAILPAPNGENED